MTSGKSTTIIKSHDRGEAGFFAQVLTSAGNPNVRAGVVSVGIATFSDYQLCEKENTGEIATPFACLLKSIEGTLFLIYGMYRFGWGFSNQLLRRGVILALIIFMLVPNLWKITKLILQYQLLGNQVCVK